MTSKPLMLGTIDWMNGASKNVMRRAFVVIVVAAIALNILKAWPHVVFDIALPYWLLTYDEGFIRRGLVGTLVHELIAGYELDVQRRQIIGIYVTVAIAFLTLLCVWAIRASARTKSPRTRTFVLAGTAALMLSHFATTTIGNCGYLDVFLFCAATGCAWLVERDRLRLAGLVAAIGPFVHDAFVFLWAPIALVVVRRLWRLSSEERRRKVKSALPLASPLLTTALVMALHSQQAAHRLLDRMPVASEIKDSFRLYQFGLGIGDAFAIMIGKYKQMPEQFLLACLFFLPPIIVTALCAYAIDKDVMKWRRALFAVSVTFAPCLALLVAWDLSRILVWSGIGAFVLLIGNAADAQADDRRASKVPLLALAALVFVSTGPYVYTYFEVAYPEYPAAPELSRHTPAATLTYAFLRLYNRRLFTREWATDARSQCNADAAWVERVEACSFVLRGGQDMSTSELWLAPGTYVATVSTAPAEGCGSSANNTATIAPHFMWRFGRKVSPTRVSVRYASTTTITFSLTEEESAMTRVRVRVSAAEGCFRVDRISVVAKDAPFTGITVSK